MTDTRENRQRKMRDSFCNFQVVKCRQIKPRAAAADDNGAVKLLLFCGDDVKLSGQFTFHILSLHSRLENSNLKSIAKIIFRKVLPEILKTGSALAGQHGNFLKHRR